MLYTMECDCGHVDDYMMGMDEVEKWVECTGCGAQICRRHHRVFQGMNLQIQGDTVSGGCNWEYHDENLGVQITSKQHRKDEMKKQGLVEYSPDPEMKKIREEARYIAKHTQETDGAANAAIKKSQVDASEKRREKIIDQTFKDAGLGGQK